MTNHQLEIELQLVEAEQQRLQVVAAYLRSRLGAPETRKSPRKNGGVTVADAAQDALEAAGAPLRARDLVQAVQSRGAKLKDAEGLYKTLNRYPDRFERVGRGLWTLKGQTAEPASGLPVQPPEHAGSTN